MISFQVSSNVARFSLGKFFLGVLPLTPKLKFELAWKSSTDPFTFAAVGMAAGIAQGDRWGAYGQGAQGYAKRFGATYADVVTGTFIGGVIPPTVLKQDPRYFYQGTGNQKAAASPRAGKLARATMGAGTRITPACSANIAAGGISNLYYPSNDRNSAGVIFSTAFIRMGEIAVANIFQEFFIPKVTPTSLRELRSPETLRPSDKPNRPAIWLYSGRWQHTIPGSAPRRFAPWLPRPTAGGRSARAICADGEHPKSRAQTIQEVVALLTKVVIDGHISSRRLVGLGGIFRHCSYFKDFFSLFPFSMFPSK